MVCTILLLIICLGFHINYYFIIQPIIVELDRNFGSLKSEFEQEFFDFYEHVVQAAQLFWWLMSMTYKDSKFLARYQNRRMASQVLLLLPNHALAKNFASINGLFKMSHSIVERTYFLTFTFIFAPFCFDSSLIN